MQAFSHAQPSDQQDAEVSAERVEEVTEAPQAPEAKAEAVAESPVEDTAPTAVERAETTQTTETVTPVTQSVNETTTQPTIVETPVAHVDQPEPETVVEAVAEAAKEAVSETPAEPAPQVTESGRAYNDPREIRRRQLEAKRLAEQAEAEQAAPQPEPEAKAETQSVVEQDDAAEPALATEAEPAEVAALQVQQAPREAFVPEQTALAIEPEADAEEKDEVKSTEGEVQDDSPEDADKNPR